MKKRNTNFRNRNFLLIALMIVSSFGTYTSAQKDTIVLKNNSIIEGKVKSINKDNITLSTSYSGNDIPFKLSEIKRIDSQTKLIFKLKDGRKITSAIHASNTDSLSLFDQEQKNLVQCSLSDIKSTSSDIITFWSRFSATIGFGLNIAKANNTTQFNTRNTIGYYDDNWTFDGFFNMIYTTQESLPSTKMVEGGFGVKYALPRDWFLTTKIAFLSNTEQALKLRTSGRLGIGKNLIDKNSILWSVSLGASLLNENFSNNTGNQQSAEGFASTEFKIMDIKNFTFTTSWVVFPGITQKGRIRSDLKADIQYNLPRNFFIKGGTSYNYDNQPAAPGKDLDYNFMLTFGWKL